MLCLALISTPEVIFWLFALPDGEAVRVLAKRAGVLFLGLALVLILTRSHAPNPSRRTIQIAFAVMLCAMALLGFVEWRGGGVGPGIWSAICVELLLAAGLVVAR